MPDGCMFASSDGDVRFDKRSDIGASFIDTISIDLLSVAHDRA